MTSRFTLRAVTGLLVLATALVTQMAGCRHSAESPPSISPQVVQTSIANDYVGNAACIDCHTAECDHLCKSRHAITLRAMDRESLGRLAPPIGPIPKTGYAIQAEGDRFAIAAPRYPDMVGPLDLAFGSGKTGMTYVAVNGDTLSDAQMSYFPHLHRWYLTPGHVPKPEYVLGQTYQGEFPRKCVLCHATTLAAGTLMPEKRFFGVGCEACHGPGGAHVAAMHAGKLADLRMEKMGRWGARRINTLCGKCHVPPVDMGKQDPSVDPTHRFQPYGLMKSRCFVESGDRLSCLTCHDPHADADADKKHYVAVCLKCHAPQPASVSVAPTATIHARQCPVNPRDKCIGCHMPPRRIFEDSNVPTYLADHFIRVYR